ncbi:MAG: hypothetical protein DRP63_02845 [Planctomycetota bacterium]|nr:MAG: hypothetical protein DRP63_02845 [Planctomycetota bacterium]
MRRVIGLMLVGVLWFTGCGEGGGGRRRARKKRHTSSAPKKVEVSREQVLEQARDLIDKGWFHYMKMRDAEGAEKSVHWRRAKQCADKALSMLRKLNTKFPDDDDVQTVMQKGQRLMEAIIKDSPVR